MNEKTITREQFVAFLQNEPLLEPEPSIKGASPLLFSKEGGGIYYGTGLTTPRVLSVGLPFDVLGMVLVAEKIRRALGLSSIIHHIADTHALSNDFATQESVENLAREVEGTMYKVSAHLKIPKLRVVRSSSFDQTEEYLALLKRIDTSKGEYVRRELADVLWYRAKFDLVLKMGWIIQASETAKGFDERLYDAEYIRLFGQDLSFVYLKAGRTFDRKRPKASPYIAIPSEQRILLKAHEPVREKLDEAFSRWPDRTFGGATNHLKAIVRLYEKLMGPLDREQLEDKIQAIIDRIFNGED